MSKNRDWLTLNGAEPYRGPHSIEFDPHNGQVLLKVAVNGANFGGGEHNISMAMTKDQALLLLETLETAMQRVGYLPHTGS
ncbi:MAG: hypothetical protein KIS62_01355 [Ramlibacter sp.]|nr:hypothetical protein [Ramlibacter sp.]